MSCIPSNFTYFKTDSEACTVILARFPFFNQPLTFSFIASRPETTSTTPIHVTQLTCSPGDPVIEKFVIKADYGSSEAFSTNYVLIKT
ncbi:hypothetical protein [Paenibacillus sp. 1781tsa1]|uniref:hypothetical protein n=1 Tax=Paenibacillus sp. 1781tsa1 TaxID=2953810 RepID=UPI0020A1C251|nr:hypothetical protein [Paenibacillus sp. 1781tsa1]MCP1182831.1 hypothetical protein [Paenibacillus sp. 1781tsa1]